VHWKLGAAAIPWIDDDQVARSTALSLEDTALTSKPFLELFCVHAALSTYNTSVIIRQVSSVRYLGDELNTAFGPPVNSRYAPKGVWANLLTMTIKSGVIGAHPIKLQQRSRLK
jgi:hypothetical protein